MGPLHCIQVSCRVAGQLGEEEAAGSPGGRAAEGKGQGQVDFEAMRTAECT